MSRCVSRIALTACCLAVATAGTGAQGDSSNGSPLPSLDRPRTYTGPPLSLPEAIDEAMAHNPTLIALRREYDAARLRPSQSKFLPPPTVGAEIWQWPIDTLNPRDTNMYMFMVEQDVPGRGKRDLRAAVADRTADMAGNDIAVRARQTVADLEHAYTGLLIARRAANLYADSAVILRQLADAAEAKYAAGGISQQDVLKPAVELSKLYDEALGADQQAALQAAQLDVLIGRLPDAPIGPLADAAPMLPLPPASVLIDEAIRRQPDLQAAHLDVDRARADLALAKSDTKPDFMVQGGYMLMPQGTDAWMGRIGMTWPSAPWSRGRIEAHVAETTAEVAAAQGRLDAAESALRRSVQQAYVRVQTAQQRLALLRTTVVPQARQSFDASRLAYEADQVDFLTILESQRTLLNEQLDEARAVADLADARTDLERAVGIDLDARTVSAASPAEAAGGRR